MSTTAMHQTALQTTAAVPAIHPDAEIARADDDMDRLRARFVTIAATIGGTMALLKALVLLGLFSV
jgi:hypothetical protein